VELIRKVIDVKEIINFPILAVYSKEYSNQEVASIIAKQTQATIENIGEDFSKSFQYNNKVSKLTLNWQPKIELESGIIEFLAWKKRQS
jgi:nucleoside-diphosphate-sugar epimerase